MKDILDEIGEHEECRKNFVLLNLSFQSCGVPNLIPKLLMCPEAIFLVMLGTSSFPGGHEVYGNTT